MGTLGFALGPIGRTTEDLKLILENIFGYYSNKDLYSNIV